MGDLVVILFPALIFFILSIAFLIVGYTRKRRIKQLHLTTGKIIKKGRFFKQTPDYFPTVTYEVDGQLYEYTSRVSQRPGLKPGTSVGVFYHPDHPEQAMIDTFVQRGSVFTLIGGIFGAISLVGIVVPILGFLL